MKKETVRLDQATIERLKQDISVLDVLSRYGIPTEKRGKNHFALCPFHSEDTPSLAVDPVRNTWKCFGCGKGSSVVDFVMEKEGLDFAEAARKLLTDNPFIMTGTDLLKKQSVPKSEEVVLSPEERRHVADVVEHYHRTLSGEDTRGLDYLRRRHIADPETLKAFKVGYCNGTLKKVLPASASPTLKKIGLLRKDGTETFEGCIVIPVFAADGNLGECFARFLVDRKPTNHLYLPGPHRGVLNAKAAEVHPDGLILTEAAFDALTFYAHGIRNVIPCYGTGGFTPDHLAALTRGGVRKVFVAFDNDQAGEDGAKRLAQTLDAQACQAGGMGIECHRVKVPEELGKDINEYVSSMYRAGMKSEETTAALKDLVAKASRFGFRRAAKAGRLTLAEQTDESLVFSNCDLSYRLRGLFDNNPTSLRVILTASREDAAHTDRFDLYTAKSRASFTYRAAHRLELPAVKIEQDLDALIPLLEILLAEGRGRTENPKGPPPMSETERQEALRLLRSKNLLQRIAANLETVGYVGEQQPKQLAYLIATSRKLDKPLSAIIRSESGAGKSYLMECIAELMPEEDVQYFSRLTPQSLYYMGENELVHKLLIVDERDGSDEAEYPIRTLQTRRKLTLAVPMKDASSGKIKTIILVIYGPIAYMESSTKLHINPENLNRCFEIYLDESEKQTKRIYAFQSKAHTPEGWNRNDRKAATLRRHHNAQRLLEPVRVWIPYHEFIAFPASWTRGRRDHDRLFCLIEVIAFLHQFQRERTSDGNGGECILATIDDYAAAYDLARTAFAQALADLPRNARLVLTQIRNMVKDVSEGLNVSERDYGFRRRDVREYTSLPDHQVKRAMKTLEELEYVHVRRGGRGGSFIYHLATDPREKDPLEGLTTPEQLRKAWKSTIPAPKGVGKVEQSGTRGCSTFQRG